MNTTNQYVDSPLPRNFDDMSPCALPALHHQWCLVSLARDIARFHGNNIQAFTLFLYYLEKAYSRVPCDLALNVWPDQFENRLTITPVSIHESLCVKNMKEYEEDDYRIEDSVNIFLKMNRDGLSLFSYHILAFNIDGDGVVTFDADGDDRNRRKGPIKLTKEGLVIAKDVIQRKIRKIPRLQLCYINANAMNVETGHRMIAMRRKSSAKKPKDHVVSSEKTGKSRKRVLLDWIRNQIVNDEDLEIPVVKGLTKQILAVAPEGIALQAMAMMPIKIRRHDGPFPEEDRESPQSMASRCVLIHSYTNNQQQDVIECFWVDEYADGKKIRCPLWSPTRRCISYSDTDPI